MKGDSVEKRQSYRLFNMNASVTYILTQIKQLHMAENRQTSAVCSDVLEKHSHDLGMTFKDIDLYTLSMMAVGMLMQAVSKSSKVENYSRVDCVGVLVSVCLLVPVSTAVYLCVCLSVGGSDSTEWEDITGSTKMTVVKGCVTFTSAVSAR